MGSSAFKMKAIGAIIIFISITVISGALNATRSGLPERFVTGFFLHRDSVPKDSQPDNTHSFCKASWLKYKCLTKCSKPYVCSSWIKSKCEKCKDIHSQGEQPVKTLSYYVPASSNSNSFCKAAWLKSKCLSDCRNKPESCTSWVQAQCQICNLYPIVQEVVTDVVKDDIKDTNETPVQDTNETPVQDTNETPVKNTIETPVKDSNETPVNDTIETPVKETNETTVKETMQTPVKDTNETPVKDDTNETPVKDT